MIGREGPGPERPGPDYPPEWDQEPAEPDEERPCGLCGLVPREGERHRQVYGGGPDGDDVEEVCVGENRRQLDYADLPTPPAPLVPDPWLDPEAAARAEPPPF